MRNQWRRWVKLEKLTSLSSQTSSTSIIIDPGGSWAISIKEKPGRRDQVTCLEVDQLLDRPTSDVQFTNHLIRRWSSLTAPG